MTDTLSIYYNPACSKCREALQLLRARGVEPRRIDYLSVSLDPAELVRLIERVGQGPLALVRTKEAAFAGSGLQAASSAREVAEVLVRTPSLLERPVVVRGERALVARPPERVAELFEG